MIPLRATALIDAPEGAVRRVLGRTDVWTRTARAMGARAEVAGEGPWPRAPLRHGDLIRLAMDGAGLGWFTHGRPAAGRWAGILGNRPVILRVHRDGQPAVGAETASALPDLPRLELVAGPLQECRIELRVTGTAAGTLVTVDTRLQASPALLTPLLRRRVLEGSQLLLGIATLAAREVQVVVAAAIVDNGRVLAARRSPSMPLAGRWELPGGKVDPGETETGALARELSEELGVATDVAERVGPDVDLGDNMILRCFRVALTDGRRPWPAEHDAVRWLGVDELESVDWLDADRSIVPELRASLTR